MKDPLGVSPSKGNQRTTRGREKIILALVGIEPTVSGLEKNFFFTSCGSLIPFTRANA